MSAPHTPTPNDSILRAAQGNLAYLLSMIRCGEKLLYSDEEANMRRIIEELGKHEIEERETAAELDRLRALLWAFTPMVEALEKSMERCDTSNPCDGDSEHVCRIHILRLYVRELLKLAEAWKELKPK